MLISKIQGGWWLNNISILHIILLLFISGNNKSLKSIFQVRKNGMTNLVFFNEDLHNLWL